MCSPAHANHPWPFGCTCNRIQHTSPPSPVPTQSALKIGRGRRSSVPFNVGHPWYPSSTWRASDLLRAAGFTGRLLGTTLLKRKFQPPSAPTPCLLTCLPPVGICLSLWLLLEIPYSPPPHTHTSQEVPWETFLPPQAPLLSLSLSSGRCAIPHPRPWCCFETVGFPSSSMTSFTQPTPNILASVS